MRTPGSGPLTRQVLFVCALLGGMPPLAAAAPETAKALPAQAPAAPLVEAFQKGPISISAKVTRALAPAELSVLPLFQVPVLKLQDKLDLSFSGEAFDQRVTSADWSLIVVFLPRTIAPTDQGVVDYTLKRKDDRMVIPTISVPYDSIPMIFLIPDKNARKKVLKDLNDHLEAFRTLCAKIADITTERAAAGGVVDISGDRIPGVLQRLREDLVAPVGKVVVDRAAGRTTAGEHLVDGHARGAALPHHLSGADQHLGSGIAALPAGLCR